MSQNTESHNDAFFFTIPGSAFEITVVVVSQPVALEIIVGPIVIVVDWLLKMKPFHEYVN